VFPGLLALSTVLVLVSRELGWDSGELERSIVGRLPLIGDQVLLHAGKLSGGVATITIGMLVALVAAGRVFSAILDLNDDVWETPDSDRLGFTRRRTRAARAVILLGGGGILGTAATALVSVNALPVLGNILGPTLALALNSAVTLGLLRLASVPRERRELKKGIIIAAVLFTLLQLFGVAIVSMLSSGEQGPFTGTFILLGWLWLHSLVITLACEFNYTHNNRRTL
jgi:uncharacterized BrkB/YihY/UPF0761 family membrane protein